jgi:hypothetical protein
VKGRENGSVSVTTNFMGNEGVDAPIWIVFSYIDYLADEVVGS